MKLWDQMQTLGRIETELGEAASSLKQAKRDLATARPADHETRIFTSLLQALEHQQAVLKLAKEAIVARATA